MIDTRHENELFYGNQENISCGICESFLEINDALLNNGYNINIWLILLTLSLAILMWYIFYKPMYWMKDLTDIGYNSAKSKNKRIQKITIDRMRRLRNFGEKIPPPYPNGWFAIADSKEVQTGRAISVDCLGEHLVVLRTESGEVNILNAYCSHMGANLGHGGLVKGNCIECPFHQWKFSGADGSLVHIPYSKNINEVAEKAKLKKWTSFETNGLIFLWYHAENDDPWKIPVVQEIENKDWVFLGKNQFFVNSHIQDIPENGADVAHLESVHGPGIQSGNDLRFTRFALSSLMSHEWRANWSQSEDDKHIAIIQLTHCIKILGMIDLLPLTGHIKQIGPGYVQLFLTMALGNVTILQTVVPIEPYVQKFSHYFYGPRWLAPLIKFTLLAESIMVERDIMVWNHKTFIHNPLLVKEDKKIKSFRTWYSQFYSENSVSFLATKNDLSW